MSQDEVLMAVNTWGDQVVGNEGRDRRERDREKEGGTRRPLVTSRSKRWRLTRNYKCSLYQVCKCYRCAWAQVSPSPISAQPYNCPTPGKGVCRHGVSLHSTVLLNDFVS